MLQHECEGANNESGDLGLQSLDEEQFCINDMRHMTFMREREIDMNGPYICS